MNFFILVFYIINLFKINLSFSYDDCNCGNNYARILKGNDVTSNKYSYQVSIMNIGYWTKHFFRTSSLFLSDEEKKNYFKCSGVIVNNYYIMTVASCFDGVSPKEIIDGYVVMAGDNKLLGQYDLGFSSIIDYITFEDRSVSRNTKDIALILIDPPLEFNDKIRPACFSKLTYSRHGLYKNITVSGWGSTEQVSFIDGKFSKVEYSNQLKEISLQEVNDDWQCNHYHLSLSHICAENTDKGRHVCIGDKGSPLSHFTKSEIFVAGLHSHMFSKNNETVCSGVSSYTRVSFYQEWLEKKLDKQICFYEDSKV